MNGRIDTRVGVRFYIDTNVYIEAFERRGALSDRLNELLAVADEHGVPRLVTSELTLAELLVRPLAKGQSDLIAVYDNLTISNPFLEVVPIDRECLVAAAKLRAEIKSIKLPDAIHFATARMKECRYFLTADGKIKSAHGIDILNLNLENIEFLVRGLRDEIG
jgi:predicted nucleic acid-binding protein